MPCCSFRFFVSDVDGQVRYCTAQLLLLSSALCTLINFRFNWKLSLRGVFGPHMELICPHRIAKAIKRLHFVSLLHPIWLYCVSLCFDFALEMCATALNFIHGPRSRCELGKLHLRRLLLRVRNIKVVEFNKGRREGCLMLKIKRYFTQSPFTSKQATFDHPPSTDSRLHIPKKSDNVPFSSKDILRSHTINAGSYWENA